MKKYLEKIVVCVCIVSMFIFPIATPLSVLAFDENAIELDIDTSTVEVRDVWQQVKNAALIHLISQKMKVCADIGQIILNDEDTGNIFGGTVWPRESKILEKGVLDRGNVFKGAAIISGDIDTNVGVGTWFSDLYGQDDGVIECSEYTTGGINLFDMFTYIIKNYKSGMDASDLEGASVTEQDRLNIVCNKDDLTKPGILAPSTWTGEIKENVACNSNSFEYYTGVSISEQQAYLARVYEDMRASSGNPYILPWDELGYYDEVDGYYLYSNDFDVQCSGSSFTSKNRGDDGYTYIEGKEIKSNGTIKTGYYKISEKDDKARQSFVAGTRTCAQLVEEMNDHITTYVQTVNKLVYDVCKSGIDEMIDEKKKEITEKYLDNESSSNEEVEDANSVIDEYARIQSEHEYVARNVGDGDDEDEDDKIELVSITSEAESDMPDEYVIICRKHLPFIDVEVDKEADLKGAIENEAKDYCYDVMDLAWVTCPILNGLGNAVDALMEWIDGFF